MIMQKLASTLLISTLFAAASCQGQEAPEPTPAETDSGVEVPVTEETEMASDEVSLCKDDSLPIEGTELCASAALLHMDLAADHEPMALADPSCEWVPQASPMVDQYLVYMAQKCEGVTGKLEIAIGNHRSDVLLVKSALSASSVGDGTDGSADPYPVGYIYTTIDGLSAEESILKRAELDAVASEESFEGCELHTDGDGLYVVRLSEEGMDKLDPDMPPAVCGPLGMHDGGWNFWKILSDDFLMFVETSGDLWHDVDYTTMKMVSQ